MNIYTSKKEELEKIGNKFKKSVFGMKVKLFSMIPLILAFCCIAASIVWFSIELDPIIGTLFIVSAMICLTGHCIVQLLYANMLKDFADSKRLI